MPNCWQSTQAEPERSAPVKRSVHLSELRVLVAYPDGTVCAVEPRLLEAAADELGICDESLELSSCWTKPAETPPVSRAAPVNWLVRQEAWAWEEGWA